MGIDFEVIWAVEFDNAIRFYVRHPTRRPKSHQSSKKMTDISFVMGMDFGVIWAADCDDDFRFTVCQPIRQSRVTRRPRHIKILKNMTYIVISFYFGFIYSILGLFGPLVSMMTLDFKSTTPPAGHGSPAVTPKFKENYRYIVMGIDFGVIRVTEFDNDIRYYVRRPARQQRANRRHIKILK